MSVTHTLWLIIGWCTAGSFVLYFNDAPTLVRSFLELNVSSTILMYIIGLTLSTYLMAGFAREQVCTFMCPYARFQSAMFDKDTLIIGYDQKRGEIRGKHKKGDSWDNRGHCIDCTACVQVCPMGIDICEGLQMECIACGLCIDACDGIMDKLELPRGLIRYDTETRLDAQKEGKEEKLKFIRPRTIYYSIILALVGTLMLYTLLTRPLMEISVLHDRNPFFVALSDGSVRNGYVIKILNKSHDPLEYSLSIDGLKNAKIEIQSAGKVSTENLSVPANDVGHYKVLVKAPLEPQAPKNIKFIVTENKSKTTATYDTIFVSQKQGGYR